MINSLDEYKRIAIDTNIFIYHFEQNPKYRKVSEIVFKGLISKKYSAVTSVLTISEILSFPMGEKKVKHITEEFYATPNLKVLDITSEIAIEAASIRREYKFRLPDSIQLATAIIAKAEIFITNDKQLKCFDRVKVII